VEINCNGYILPYYTVNNFYEGFGRNENVLKTAYTNQMTVLNASNIESHTNSLKSITFYVEMGSPMELTHMTKIANFIYGLQYISQFVW